GPPLRRAAQIRGRGRRAAVGDRYVACGDTGSGGGDDRRDGRHGRRLGVRRGQDVLLGSGPSSAIPAQRRKWPGRRRREQWCGRGSSYVVVRRAPQLDRLRWRWKYNERWTAELR